MNNTTTRTVRLCALWAATAAAAAAVWLCVTALPLQQAAVTRTPAKGAVILIDAGHGGIDGGAVAPDGTPEKALNLDISLKLADFLRLLGYPVRLTRTEDISLHDANASTVREKKVSDLHARLALYDEADLVISIHQNKFGTAAGRGVQVFYAPQHPSSKTAATVLRETLLSLLQPDNRRELKCGDETIFLLYKTASPAVLVECGFLSNPEECARLLTDAYRQELAFALACGVLRYAP